MITPKNLGKWWPTLSEVQMSEFSWQLMKEGNRRMREVDILKWIYRVRLENTPDDIAPQESQEDTPIAKTRRNDLWEGTTRTKMSSGVLVCRPELFVGAVITAMGMVGLQNGGNQVAMLLIVRQVDVNIAISTKVWMVTKGAWPAESY